VYLRDLVWRSAATSAHHGHHRVDDFLVFKRFVDFPEPRLHQPLRLRQHETEQHHVRKPELGVSSSDHAAF
jgi:hypothetical protein